MESMLTISVVLLAAGVLLLFLLLLAVVRAGGCLQRVERLLAERDSAAPSMAPAEGAEKPTTDSAFREFLSEDPARRKLPKREQFDAFRLWRKDKGLNWSKP
ncbi:MAG: hypothetical protein RLZZ522_338 [Verrucomicrobiota bacterium]|jgi:hypothetical protein